MYINNSSFRKVLVSAIFFQVATINVESSYIEDLPNHDVQVSDRLVIVRHISQLAQCGRASR